MGAGNFVGIPGKPEVVVSCLNAFPTFILLIFALVDVSSLGRFSASPFFFESRAMFYVGVMVCEKQNSDNLELIS